MHTQSSIDVNAWRSTLSGTVSTRMQVQLILGKKMFFIAPFQILFGDTENNIILIFGDELTRLSLNASSSSSSLSDGDDNSSGQYHGHRLANNASSPY